MTGSQSSHQVMKRREIQNSVPTRHSRPTNWKLIQMSLIDWLSLKPMLLSTLNSQQCVSYWYGLWREVNLGKCHGEGMWSVLVANIAENQAHGARV